MITFKKETITIKAKQNGVGEVLTLEREAQVAYVDDMCTGLGYRTDEVDADGEAIYNIQHLPTGGALLAEDYSVGSEQVAKDWIELCLNFADWTGERPVITSMKHVLKYATIGAREEA